MNEDNVTSRPVRDRQPSAAALEAIANGPTTPPEQFDYANITKTFDDVFLAHLCNYKIRV